MLSIRLLGSPEITLNGQPLEVVRRKSRAILYTIAADPKPVKREHLLPLFWPEMERATALQNLRTTLYGLRKEVGADLRVGDDEVSLAPESQVDCRTFAERLAKITDDIEPLEETLALYQGDFLQDFYLTTSVEFDDWLMLERERYRRMAVRGLLHLSRLHEARHDFTRALAIMERALASDLLQEDLQRETMRLLYLSGDRPGAIRHYDQLRKLLDEEMGVPPMLETRQMYDAILQDQREALLQPKARKPAAARAVSRQKPASAAGPQGAAAFDLPFAGRETELQALGQAAAAGRLVWVEGEPGIGKTRLVEEFLRSSGSLALSGAGRELERVLPYQPVIEALRSLLSLPEWPAIQPALRAALPPMWLAETARLLPELDPSRAGPARPAQPGADESRLWEGVNQFLAALARLHPAAFFIDDLHWADASTLGLFAYLVRQAGGKAIHFLAASRTLQARTPAATLLANLTREGRITRIPLARLSKTDVEKISRQLSPAYAHPLAEWLMSNSEGSPYVLAALIRYAWEQGILVHAQGAGQGSVANLNAISSSPVIPQSVYSLIQERIERLSEQARRLLSAAVAAGREFTFEVVARAAALSDTAAMEALDELRQEGLVYPLDLQHFRFDHPLTMEVAYREVGEPHHRYLHRRVAEAMEQIHPRRQRNELAGIIASHFIEGLNPQRAAPYALTAGQRASRLAAWSEAIQFYEQALSGTESHGLPGEGSETISRFSILMALGNAHYQAGNNLQAAESFREALNLATNSDSAEEAAGARLALGRSLLAQARFQEAIVLAQKVLAGGQDAHAMSAEFLWGTALSLEGADLEEAALHLKLADALCSEQCESLSGDTQVDFARIRFELGSISAQQGDLVAAVDLYRQALALACAVESEAALPWCILAHNNLAYHLFLLGDASAEGYALEGLRMAQEKGMLWQQTYLYSTLGEIALQREELAEAARYFETGLELAERLAVAERVAGLTANLGRLAAQSGEQALAIHHLSSALAKAEAIGTRHLAAQIRLWLVPLIPKREGSRLLEDARAFAESSGRRSMLAQVQEMEKTLAE